MKTFQNIENFHFLNKFYFLQFKFVLAKKGAAGGGFTEHQ